MKDSKDLSEQFQFESQKKLKNPQTQQLFYEQLSKTQLVKQIKNKDKIIQSLKQTIRNQNRTDKQKLNMYRLKLEQQIMLNEKAVKAFENITETILQILNKYQFIDQNTRESVNNIMRQSRGAQKLISSEERNQTSEYSTVEDIINQTTKLLQYLSKLTDQNVNYVLKLKSQLIRIKSQPQKINQYQQQIFLLKQEIHTIVIENKNLKKLLSENQQEKHKLLFNINTNVDEEMVGKLNKLSNDQLIYNIKKLSFRVKQLEVDKRKIYAQFRVQKQANHSNYQAILNQVKTMKTEKKNKALNY